MDSFSFCLRSKNFLMACVEVSPSPKEFCSTWNTASGVFFSSSGRSRNSSLAAPSKWYSRKSTASASDWELVARLASSIQSSIRWINQISDSRKLSKFTFSGHLDSDLSWGRSWSSSCCGSTGFVQLGLQRRQFVSEGLELLSSGHPCSLLVPVFNSTRRTLIPRLTRKCKTANTVNVATTDTSLRFTSLLAITTGTRNKTKKRERVTLKYN